MLTRVERVLILKGADLLREVGPRRLLKLAEVAREVELSKDDTIYREEDAADALYMVVEGRVRLSAGDRVIAEVGPGEAFVPARSAVQFYYRRHIVPIFGID